MRCLRVRGCHFGSLYLEMSVLVLGGGEMSAVRGDVSASELEAPLRVAWATQTASGAALGRWW